MIKIKEKIQVRMLIGAVPVVLFFIFLFGTMALNAGKVKAILWGTQLSFQGLASLADSFEETLQENFRGKNYYIDLNGLTVRAEGINSLNECQKLANGYLSNFDDAVDVSQQAENVIALNEFLSERDISFLYVLAPSKNSIYDAEFAPGYGSEASQNIDTMINALSDAGVNAIDMDNWFEENGWGTEDVFFVTDHHWKPEAAFAATHEILKFMQGNFGIGYDDSMSDYSFWTVDTYSDFFLGYYGKRVGTKYAGVDDIKIIYRKDQSNVSFSCLTTSWGYRDSVFSMGCLEKLDYYNSDPYYSYIGTNYTIANIVNEKAYNDLKVMVVGDSFRIPVETFLSSYFSELYHIDLRYYTDGTFAQYVAEIQPDIVLLCTNEGLFSNSSFYSFGVDEYLEAYRTTSESNVTDGTVIGDILISAQGENDDNFVVACADLEPGQAYTLTLDSTAYTGGDDLYIQMTLQDLSTNTAMYNRYFDANSEETQKWIFTTPEDESGVYEIYLYAGTKGNTSGVSVEVGGIELWEGIFED